MSVLDSIHHVAIPVANVAEAVSWYREHFRCEVSYQDESWALLKFANASLALVISEQHLHSPNPVPVARRTSASPIPTPPATAN